MAGRRSHGSHARTRGGPRTRAAAPTCPPAAAPGAARLRGHDHATKSTTTARRTKRVLPGRGAGARVNDHPGVSPRARARTAPRRAHATHAETMGRQKLESKPPTCGAQSKTWHESCARGRTQENKARAHAGEGAQRQTQTRTHTGTSGGIAGAPRVRQGGRGQLHGTSQPVSPTSESGGQEPDTAAPACADAREGLKRPTQRAHAPTHIPRPQHAHRSPPQHLPRLPTRACRRWARRVARAPRARANCHRAGRAMCESTEPSGRRGG